MSGRPVTIVIPTFNGEAYLADVLDAIQRQGHAGERQVIVVDSGSTDATLDILAGRPWVEVIRIPNAEFGHGRTRAMAAEQARGDVIVYLTQDAVPVGTDWLAELLAPFELDEGIGLVTGRQQPRPRAFPLQRYEIIGVFDNLGPRDGITVYGAGARPLEGASLDAAAFHSDVNAAVRAVALREVPFRDVPYSEDQMMGRDMLAAGWRKAYAGRASVEHSNDLTFGEYGRRIFDETVGLRRIGTPIPPLGRGAQLRLTVRGIAGDSLRILRDGFYGRRAKLGWLVRNPAYHVRKWAAYRRATLVALDDHATIDKGSLESSRRRDR